MLSSGIFAPPHIAAAIGAMLEHSEESEPHRSDNTDHDVLPHDVFPHDAMAQMVASDDEACLKSKGLPLTDSYTSAPPLKKHLSALELSALALFEAFKTKPRYLIYHAQTLFVSDETKSHICNNQLHEAK